MIDTTLVFPEVPAMPAARLSMLLVVFLMQAVAERSLEPLLDFAAPETAQRWQAVNDGVMGGVSDGRFRITADETEVSVPLADLIPTAFGRRVQGMGPVEPSQINGLG
ncbi:MAG: CIA30 family protein, partial [Planctomycetia bacterium]